MISRKLWIRGRLEENFGVIPGINAPLGDLRLQNTDLATAKKREEEHTKAYQITAHPPLYRQTHEEEDAVGPNVYPNPLSEYDAAPNPFVATESLPDLMPELVSCGSHAEFPTTTPRASGAEDVRFAPEVSAAGTSPFPYSHGFVGEQQSHPVANATRSGSAEDAATGLAAAQDYTPHIARAVTFANDSDLHNLAPKRSNAQVSPEADPNVLRGDFRKRKRRTLSLSLSDVASQLDGEVRGLYWHIVKQCSISNMTVASRVSSTLSISKIRTEGSEFQLYYDRPGENDEQQVPAVEAVAVNIMLNARNHSLDDEQVLQNFNDVLPGSEAERRGFVNVKDWRGVTALHLAVAYGYLGTCGLLLKHGADHTAQTVQETHVWHFSKPAEKLAGNDVRLYARIKVCRVFVRYGYEPPVPPHVHQRLGNAQNQKCAQGRRRRGARKPHAVSSNDAMTQHRLVSEEKASQIPLHAVAEQSRTGIPGDSNPFVFLPAPRPAHESQSQILTHLTQSPSLGPLQSSNFLPLSHEPTSRLHGQIQPSRGYTVL